MQELFNDPDEWDEGKTRRRVLPDGKRIISDHAAFNFSPTFADGSPDHTSPHRPGFRFADTSDPDRLAAGRAYRERTARLQDAWRKNAAPTQCTDAAQARAVADRAWLDKKERLQNSWRTR